MSLLGTITEKDFMAHVIDLARLCGFAVYHTHDSRRSDPGFPDLVLAREKVLFVELKSAKGRLTPDQRRWGQALLDAGASYHVWTPADMPAIERVLARPSRGVTLLTGEAHP